MTDALYHRGPDSGGTQVERVGDLEAGLGARRLSILDLSPAGNQPMATEDGDVLLAYNGEVYNFAELRAELQAAGHRFRSRSDTETVLRAYRAWGLDALARLQGMFGLAIFDRRAGRVVVARDRMGIKPLYYHWDGSILRFASELKALLQDPSIPRRIDREALDLYLSVGYVPSPHSLLDGVRKLEPGHALIVNEDGLTQRPFCSWQPAADVVRLSREELIARVRQGVERAVRRQLVSDVPVGLLLSGGIDSSIVATVAAASSERPLHTFSAAYEAAGSLDGSVDAYNEDRQYAARLADQLGFVHHDVLVKTDRCWEEELPRLAAALDEPLFEPVYLTLHLLCAEAQQQGVRVLLTGDGADELFYGYGARYAMPARGRKYRRLPLGRAVAGAAARWAPSPGLRQQASNVYRLLSARTPAQRYLVYSEIFPVVERADLLGDPRLGRGETPAERVVAAAMQPAAERDFVQAFAFADLRLWVREHWNPRLDRISMRHSIEARVPFQDDELIDQFGALAPELNLSGTVGKQLLRQAFADHLPPDVLHRAKRPFMAPGVHWVRSSLGRFARELLAPSRLRRFDLLAPAAADRVLQRAIREGEARSLEVWTVLALQLWCEAYLGSAPPSPAPRPAAEPAAHCVAVAEK